MAWGQNTKQKPAYRLVFWNVENLYDTRDDSCKNDDAFTPTGENHWSYRRYKHKLESICRVLAEAGQREDGIFEMPQIVGMAEVENDRVLRDLCNGTALRKYGYRFVHYESPDTRGIDNALLYRKDFFTPFHSRPLTASDSSKGLITRDILLVEGITNEGDTLIMVVNHFPSKLGGASTDSKRGHVARQLRETLDTLARNHPDAAIVVMGDFNASPDEPEIKKTLMHGGRSNYVNLMSKMEKGVGSHNYQGHWSFLDQIIVPHKMLNGKSTLQVAGGTAHLLAPEFMLVDDEKNSGKKPFRTYIAQKYTGGYSDHLPVYVDLSRTASMEDTEH